MNCSLDESEFRPYPKVVLDWFLGLPNGVLGLPILGCGHWLCAIPLIMSGRYAPVSRCSCRVACMPHNPQLSYAAGCTMSEGFVLAPPPYRMVNAGSCDYKKKNKKKNPDHRRVRRWVGENESLQHLQAPSLVQHPRAPSLLGHDLHKHEMKSSGMMRRTMSMMRYMYC